VEITTRQNYSLKKAAKWNNTINLIYVLYAELKTPTLNRFLTAQSATDGDIKTVIFNALSADSLILY
jgi:hypothetical protein